jgi:RNA polymerase sigma-70 factor, ECF subfamily
MTGKTTRPEKPVSRSTQGISGQNSDNAEAQLSAAEGVESDVSSMAMDRAAFAMAKAQASMPPANVSGGEALTDADIMLRVKTGDQSAFEFLVEKYRRPMVSFMYRMARSSAAAEDLAQEVFLRVYRSREGYEASAKFTTWLYRIATNLAMNHVRDTRNERPEKLVSLDEPDQETGLTMDVPDSTLSAEEAILRRERLVAIRQKVQDLPERQRLAVIMHKYQEMDYKQIGEVLKLSESAT